MANVCMEYLIILFVIIGSLNNVCSEQWSYFHDGCQTPYGRIGLLYNLFLSHCTAECNANTKCTVFGYSSSDKMCLLFDETFSIANSECSLKTVMFYKVGNFSGGPKPADCGNATDYTYVTSLNKCIRYKSSNRLSWNDAKEDCEKEGTHLIYVKTKAVLDYIQGFLETVNSKYWIGGKQSAVGSNKFEWLSGETIDVSNGGNLWLEGRPAVDSPTDNYCIETKTSSDRKSFGLYEKPCTHSHRFFCELDIL
ncbi:C-type mannose receptor 2-like [Ruditapes philippinarum]|uniref:C-type mannose receptor 2-like n=1 Tax=Ruditapes philippinarum TaxID=129788 RepID=UPI00295B8EB0|nr:C-type mannose receptor 2-like [Ruditapes philippinarum]